MTRPAASDSLIDLHERVRRFALARTHNTERADDIAQEVLLRLWQALQTDQAPTQPLGWVLRTARNLIVDEARRAGRRAVTIPDELWDGLASPPADSTPAGLAECLEVVIDKLPDGYRDLIRRVDLREDDRASVARETGLSNAALKSRVIRGRRLLHAQLLACCDFGFSDRDGTLQEIAPRTTDADAGCTACGCTPTD